MNYSPSICKESFSGNIILYLSKENKEPKDGDVGFETFPCYSSYVQNIEPGSYVTIADNAISYPVVLSDMERGEYFVQAVWDRNMEGRSIPVIPGNMYSKPQKVLINRNRQQVFLIQSDNLVPEPAFKEADFVKELKESPNFINIRHLQ